jgi:hypothetical protein
MKLTKLDVKNLIREALREALDAANADYAIVEENLDDQPEEALDEGIFGNKYKGKTILAYRGEGKDEPVAIGEIGANLTNFKQAHAKKYNHKESDYTPVHAGDVAVKRYGKALKSIPDVTSELPSWVKQYVADAKAKADKDFRNAEIAKKNEADAKKAAARRNVQKSNSDDDDDRIYVQGKGYGTYQYRTREDLEESEGDDDYVYIQGDGYGTYRPRTREGLEESLSIDSLFEGLY